jgi:hypothetical protein
MAVCAEPSANPPAAAAEAVGNKASTRQVERWACRILSDRIRLCFSWHLSIPVSPDERKVRSLIAGEHRWRLKFAIA